MGLWISESVTVLSIRIVFADSVLLPFATPSITRFIFSQVSGVIRLIVLCSTNFLGNIEAGKRSKAW